MGGTSPTLAEHGPETEHRDGSSAGTNSSEQHRHETCGVDQPCSATHLIPAWLPPPQQLSILERCGRAAVYATVLVYMFIGMSMVADTFCAAIDHIISRKRQVKVRSRLTGSVHYISIPIWNETVAHLTLFVLGNCAPDILLTLIEVIVNDFDPGHLGPGVIIGTGALNLFFIQTICILVVERGITKRQEDLRLYFVTAGFSLFGYIWLYLILDPISKGVVEPWEAFLTLSFYPLTVVIAYVVERRFFGYFSRLRRHRNRVGTTLKELQGSSEGSSELGPDGLEAHINDADEVEMERMKVEARQNRFLQILKEMRTKHPNMTQHKIQELAERAIIDEMPKSLGYYRMLASKGLSGGGDIINKEKLRLKFEDNTKKDDRFKDPNVQLIMFDPIEYIVMEDCGSFDANVTRLGAHIDNEVAVDYATEDGTGVAGSDYEAVRGTLLFKKGKRTKHITIKIIDDDVFNMDTQFYLNLSNVTLLDPGTDKAMHPKPMLDNEGGKAKITKVDDDHGGIFHFQKAELVVEEDAGVAQLHVTRSSGAKGCVALPFSVKSNSALPNIHYAEPALCRLIFQNRQTEQNLSIKVLNEGRLTKNVKFEVALEEPYFYDGKMEQKNSLNKTSDLSKLGRPKLGDDCRVVVTITENSVLRQAVDNLANIDIAELVGATSWSAQFKEAVAVPATGIVVAQSSTHDNDDDADEIRKTTCRDYVTHVLTIFWKVVFAFIPPADYVGGWAAFLVAFSFIGILVAIIADVSKQLGCVIGLHDEVTAITLVSFGTSLPDLFASILAAKREQRADAAIGHINGACAVLVYVGLGLSWSVCAIKNALDGKDMRIKVHGLTFSITIFFSFSAISTVVLLLRRLKPVGGELGGPMKYRVLTAVLFICLWIGYVTLSALSSYCAINTF